MGMEEMEEKVAVAQRVFEHLTRRDPPGAAESFQPKAEFDFTRSRGPNRGLYVGRSRIQRNWEDFIGAWEVWVMEPHDFVELSDDRVLFSVRGRMVGRDGIELTVKAAHIWTFRDGLVEHAEFFQSREDALAAADVHERSA